MTSYEKIAELCKKNNITIKALELAVGQSDGSINKWKSSSPSSDKLAKIADYFDVSVDYLLGRSTPTSKPLDSLTSSVLDVCDKLSCENKTKLLAYAKGLSDAT